MIHSFDPLDLPTLHRLRHEGLCTDSTLALTWGITLVPAGALLAYLGLATGVFTYLSSPDGTHEQTVLAQAVHNASSPSARLSFLAPSSVVDSACLGDLLDHLAAQVGEHGAHNLLAEVDVSTQVYDALRAAGFAIYSRQRIWKVTKNHKEGAYGKFWRSAVSKDEFAVRALYTALVPAMVHQVEVLPWERLRGMVHSQEGDLRAYVDLIYGPRGVMAQPFVHPDMEDVTPVLCDLIHNIPNRLSRPLYICIRSYQGWLESAMEEIEAEPGPRQAVMVKRMAVNLPETAPAAMPAIKGTTANPTVPIIRPFASHPKAGRNHVHPRPATDIPLQGAPSGREMG